MKIYVYCGLNIADLRFSCEAGRDVVQGLNSEGKVVHGISATSRTLPENGKHPRVYAEHLLKEIKWCKDNWDLHITTNSQVTVNLLGDMIENGLLDKDDVIIYILSSDNSKIDVISGFDSEGYLENWPYGFFDYGVNL